MEDALAVMRSREPERLMDYIRSLSRFEIYTQIDGNYGHVGAILADAILQSNNNYERNVRSRIARVREMYARETSLEDLKRLLQRKTDQNTSPRGYFLKYSMSPGSGFQSELPRHYLMRLDLTTARSQVRK
jgi:hypothetical protein